MTSRPTRSGVPARNAATAGFAVVVHREELAFPNDLLVLERDGGDPEAVPLGVVDHEAP